MSVVSRPVCWASGLRLDIFLHIDARTDNDVQVYHIPLIQGHCQLVAIEELFGS